MRECSGGILCRELGSWRSVCGSSPRDLCIDTALDPDQRASIVAELGMMGLKQVLSYHRKFDLPGSPPSQMHIGRTVTVHQLGRQGAHVAIGLIELKSFGQIESRLEGYLIVRT